MFIEYVLSESIVENYDRTNSDKTNNDVVVIVSVIINKLCFDYIIN